jgi:hypothetical protein
VSGDIAQPFLNLGTKGGVWSASRPGLLYPRERPGTHCTGGWVGPGAGLDRCGKSRPNQISIKSGNGESTLNVAGFYFGQYRYTIIPFIFKLKNILILDTVSDTKI